MLVLATQALTKTKRMKKSAWNTQKIAEYIDGDCSRDKTADMKKWPMNKTKNT